MSRIDGKMFKGLDVTQKPCPLHNTSRKSFSTAFCRYASRDQQTTIKLLGLIYHFTNDSGIRRGHCLGVRNSKARIPCVISQLNECRLVFIIKRPFQVNKKINNWMPLFTTNFCASLQVNRSIKRWHPHKKLNWLVPLPFWKTLWEHINRMCHCQKCRVISGLAFWDISLVWFGFTRICWSFTNSRTYKSKPLLPFFEYPKFFRQKNYLNNFFWLFMASFAALSAILFNWISIRWYCDHAPPA